MRFTAMANIFLLEDDKILSKGISIALKKDEHTVTAVYGYLEALQQYQKQKYDLFLLDINLPDGNGLEFCKKIRETSETPVLFLTANDTEEDMLEGFGVGCDDYISKPFSIEVLRKKVLAVLKRTGIGKFRMKYRDLELDKEKCVVLMKGQEIHLTSTEYKLLLYLMENRGRVVTKPWIPVSDNFEKINVKKQKQDRDSILEFYKKLIMLRKEKEVIARGNIEFMEVENAGVLAYTRCLDKQKLLVCCNFRDVESQMEFTQEWKSGRKILGNYEENHKNNYKVLTLRPYEIIVLEKGEE